MAWSIHGSNCASFPVAATTATIERGLPVPPGRSVRFSGGLVATAFRKLRRDRLTLGAVALLLAYAALALGAELVSTQVFGTTPTRIDLSKAIQPPSPAHWLGTDEFGRDQLVRILYGARISLTIGLSAALINLTVGVLLGAIAGFYGGRVDDGVVWLINTLRSIPNLFLLILIGALLRPGPEGLALVIGLISWPGIARVIRGQMLAARNRDFVLAAHSLGASNARLIGRHLIPNVLPIALVILGQDIGTVILLESGLSYLGLGVQPPTASWGNMLTNAQRFFSSGVWLVLAPGWFIYSTVQSLYLIADGLRDALDPRLR
jgi:peptide/nickel transport system permease protein